MIKREMYPQGGSWVLSTLALILSLDRKYRSRKHPASSLCSGRVQFGGETCRSAHSFCSLQEMVEDLQSKVLPTLNLESIP